MNLTIDPHQYDGDSGDEHRERKVTMREVLCLTLTQPWATLVAIGAKQIETRHWRTDYRGLIAIHAAKAFPDDAQYYCNREPFRTVLVEQTRIRTIWRRTKGVADEDRSDFPRGTILAVANLRNCIRTEEMAHQISEQERAFGDYSPGRWAWVLSDIHSLPEPIPARGALNLWKPEPEVAEQLVEFYLSAKNHPNGL